MVLFIMLYNVILAFESVHLKSKSLNQLKTNSLYFYVLPLFLEFFQLKQKVF